MSRKNLFDTKSFLDEIDLHIVYKTIRECCYLIFKNPLFDFPHA